jgi:acyl-CoA synthetase (AMP-forming)/AMP-acid ligase II
MLAKQHVNHHYSYSLIDVLRDRALDARMAVTFVNAGGSRRVPFADLLAQAARASTVLGRHGVRRDDIVAVLLDADEEFLVCALGLLWMGAIPVCLPRPADGPRAQARTERLLPRTGARFALVEAGRSLAPTADLRAIVAPDLLAATREVDPAPPTPRHGKGTVFLQFSSGTTGEPKKLGITSDALMTNLADMAEANGFTPRDCMVSWLPVFHDMGLVGTTLCSLFAGMSLVMGTPGWFMRDPMAWLRAIDAHRATATIAPNFAYALCARYASGAAGLDLSTLRVALNGSEVIVWETVLKFLDRFAAHGFQPQSMAPGYGLAENTLAVSFTPLGRGVKRMVVDREALKRGHVRAATEGRTAAVHVALGPPIPHTPCCILDVQGRPAPPGVVGRVAIAGDCLADGIELIQVEGTAYFDTGDLGFFDAEGELYVIGRSKDMIICAGEKFSPEEIEAIVGEVGICRPGRAIAFGVMAPLLGTERLVVAMEVEQPPDRRALRDLQEALHATFGLIPADVVLLQKGSLPLTTSGKLCRGEVRRCYEEEQRLPGEIGRAKNPVT